MTVDALHIRRIRRAMQKLQRVKEMFRADLRLLKEAEAELKAAVAAAQHPPDDGGGTRKAA